MTQAATRQKQQKEDRADALPRWDLSALYPAPEAPELTRDLDTAEGEAKDFRDRHAGKLAGMDGARLGAAVAEFEAIKERLGRIVSYAQLVHAGDMSDPEVGRFYQSIQERVTTIDAQLIFFTLELNRIEDADLEAKLKDPALATYEPWLRDLRAAKPYQLDDELERLLHEKDVAGRQAWVRLFDETMAGLRFPVDSKELTSAETLHLLSDRDETVRRTAAEAIGKVFAGNLRLFAHITNTLAKDKAIADDWRGFKRPVSSRNLANLVEDEVVDALVEATRAAYPRLSHRYYAMKAKWLGKAKLATWDRNAPLPLAAARDYAWDEARQTVLAAYNDFSPELAGIGKRFFEADWIDAGPRPGKAPGAFAHPTVPSAHPYLLLNYQGKARDVMTLAHELGHGVHQVLAGDQGLLKAETPLTLAETASVFGEMLTFKRLLKAAPDAAARKEMLASKVEDMLNTVVRQIAFYEFERRVHDERRTSELLPERLCEIWMAVQQESLGDAFDYDEGYRVFWAYIPHFIHAPFYVYAYAFGDCLVNSLYAVYEGAQEGFAEKYLDMLRAGGTKRHKELLAPFGLDASDPGFWAKGLAVVEGFIDELAAME
ncbi:MAG: M3 family oligoendopeptidase [Alphaproteobacteria bacterium]